MFESGKIAGFSTPFTGDNAVWRNPMGWLTGSVMADDMNDMFTPEQIQANIEGASLDPAAFQYSDSAYGSPGNVRVQGARFNDNLSSEALGQQRNFTRELAQRMQGSKPSIAEEQMRRGQEQAIAGAASASAGAANPALAMRARQQAQENIATNTNQQAAMLRAQEMAGAEQRFGQHVAGMRDAAQQREIAQAQLYQQANAQSQENMMRRSENEMQAELARRDRMMRQQELESQERTNRNQLEMQRAIAQQSSDQQGKAGLIGMAGDAIGGLISDENAKTKIDRENVGRDVEQWLENLDPASYEYKPGTGGPSGRNHGVMAQSMQKSDLGKSMVNRRDDGLLEIDAKKSLAALLASQALLHKRVKSLEGKRG